MFIAKENTSPSCPSKMWSKVWLGSIMRNFKAMAVGWVVAMVFFYGTYSHCGLERSAAPHPALQEQIVQEESAPVAPKQDDLGVKRVSPDFLHEDMGSKLAREGPPHLKAAVARLLANAEQLRAKCHNRSHEFLSNNAFADPDQVVPDYIMRHLIRPKIHNSIHCLLPKVGTTSVFTSLLEAQGVDLSGVKNREEIHDIGGMNVPRLKFVHARQPNVTYRDLQKWHAKASWTLITRNPWTRVLSGYHDKFLRYPDNPGYDRAWGYLASRILKMGLHRVVAESIPNLRRNVTFVQFARYLSHMIGVHVGRLNEHWSPYSYLCQPCLLPYKYVARLEDQDEVDAVLYILSGKLPKERSVGNEFSGADVHQSGWSTDEAVRKYYTPMIQPMIRTIFGDDEWMMDYSLE